jgi:membrane-bound metal-dependent hydrolase YbcI (DUF457 family)
MPLPIAHGFLGATIVAAVYPKIKKIHSLPILFGAFLANSPDFDFALVFIFGSSTWHRGFSHSITFAIIIYLIFAYFAGKSLARAAIAFGLAFSSHAILDFVTSLEGNGVELFWLFSTERYRLGLFGLSEIPSTLTAYELVSALSIEFLIFATLFLAVFWFRKYVSTQSEKNRN